MNSANDTLTDLAAALNSFKGYTAAERRSMAKESARLQRNREAAWRDAGCSTEAEYEAWMWGQLA